MYVIVVTWQDTDAADSIYGPYADKLHAQSAAVAALLGDNPDVLFWHIEELKPLSAGCSGVA